MNDITEVTIPLPSKPQKLKLLFNNSAYLRIKKLTGLNAMQLLEDQEHLKDPEVCMGLLFAGTRKFHSNPLISEEQLYEWMDELDGEQVLNVYRVAMSAFCASFLSPGKRQEFHKTVEKHLKKLETAA